MATGNSRTRFASNWPDEAGELLLNAYPIPTNLVTGVEPKAIETLAIKFGEVGGIIEPVSFTYDNVKVRLESRGLIQPQTCPLDKR